MVERKLQPVGWGRTTAGGWLDGLADSVALRTREIAIRVALGASPADVLRLVAGDGMRLALAGAAIGLLGALTLARLMSSLLYGVKPSDPLTFLVAFAALVSVALFASYIPARRATMLDPMPALREER